MLKIILKKLYGFTLVEIMVALAINAIIFIALISMFGANLTHYRKTLDTNRLYLQLQGALDLISNDIRRAGYWTNASNDIGTGGNTNPFMTSGTDIQTGASNTCILISYDRDNNGSIPAISANYDDERYGYRLNNSAIQSRPWGATFACNATDWENITDPTVITVTQLNFTLNQQSVIISGTTGITIRSVDITVTGQLTNDASVSRTLTRSVRIQNDKFTP